MEDLNKKKKTNESEKQSLLIFPLFHDKTVPVLARVVNPQIIYKADIVFRYEFFKFSNQVKFFALSRNFKLYFFTTSIKQMILYWRRALFENFEATIHSESLLTVIQSR